MATSKVEEFYRQHIKPLLPAERLCLIELIAHDLVSQPAEAAEKPKHSIMELHGLGKEIWEGIDAQEYINELRKEWDHQL
jgi:hypothetical protein